MGGRGSSSGRGGGGIGAGGGAMPNLQNFAPSVQDFNPQSVVMPTFNDVKNGNVTPKNGVPFDKFQNMTDDEKADVIMKARMVQPPVFLDDSPLQRLAYFTGMNGKPEMMSDAALDKVKGHNIYRTVNDAYDRSKDIKYTAQDIYKQIASGDFTMYSDSGGSVHGKAIYFAGNFGGSAIYGGRSALTMRAKIKSTAKTITENDLSTLVSKEANKNSKLWQATQGTGSSQKMIIALAKGYDVVTPSYNKSGYYMVLNRSGLAMSTTTKTAGSGHW